MSPALRRHLRPSSLRPLALLLHLVVALVTIGATAAGPPDVLFYGGDILTMRGPKPQ